MGGEEQEARVHPVVRVDGSSLKTAEIPHSGPCLRASADCWPSKSGVTCTMPVEAGVKYLPLLGPKGDVPRSGVGDGGTPRMVAS